MNFSDKSRLERQRVTPEQKWKINELREGMFTKFRDVPEGGRVVKYMGKEFVVYPTVFWPHDDSIALVENYVINPGEVVLDICAGAGNIAIASAERGASKVVAYDVNPNAVRAARENVKRHGFEDIVEVREGGSVSHVVGKEESFDVITANLPFEKKSISEDDFVRRTVYDAGYFSSHANDSLFFAESQNLKPEGRIYVAQSNFGDLSAFLHEAGCRCIDVDLIGERDMQDGLRIFYAFELRRKE